MLQLFGFAPAVENHLERSIRESGAVIVCHLIDETAGAVDTLDQTVRIALFRIMQETINNAVLHSRCRTIYVTLRTDTDAMVATVRDDGRGMPSGRKRTGGGLDNMKTRARLIAASLDIGAGMAGEGTTVTASIPPNGGPANPERPSVAGAGAI